MKKLVLSLTMILLLCLSVQAQQDDVIQPLLDEIDPWVTTDTAAILAFIDSCNGITRGMIEGSEYWEPVQQDLSFLLGIDYLGSPQIDNTGRIYFMMRLTGEASGLFYVDKPMSWPIQLSPNNWAKMGFTISGFSVHPSGDFLIVQVNKHGDEMHDLWYFDRNGKFSPMLVDRQVRYGSPVYDLDNPDQFYVWINSKQGGISVGRYTMSTTKLDTLYSEPGWFSPIDCYGDKVLMVRWFSFSDGQLAILDVPSNTVTELTDTSLFWSAGFADDGTVFALTSAASSEEEYMKICTIDPNKPKELKVLIDPKKETDTFAFDRKKGAFVLVLNNDGYSELAGYDVTGAPLTIPQPEIGVISEIGSNNHGDIVFSFSSPKSPPTAYLFRLGDQAIKQIGEISTFGFDFSGVGVEVIRYKSDDGTMIPALLYTPPGAAKDGSNPAVVNYHGGPPGQSRPYFSRNLAFALSKGFVIMYPNVRGSTGYGPAWERMDNLEGRWASLQDCERALDYLIEEGWSSPKKIAVWGASYGGYVADWLATQASEKLACVISEVGVSDVDHTLVTSVNKDFMAGWEKEYGPLGSDLTHKLSPIFYANDVAVPILVTGGFNDPRVPPSDPRRFAYVLSRLDKPVYYFEETEAGHGASVKAQLVRDLATHYTFTMMHVMK